MSPLIFAQVEIRERTSTCVSRNGFCPRWIKDHLGDYVDPLVRHIELVAASVACGVAVAFALALLAHRGRWLVAPIIGITGVLYTIPSVALFTVLLPVTGFGFVTALIALSSYTLLIIFRNVVAGLDNVPAEARDAALGMGLSARQMLWRVELPLALPEILAGVRVATTTTVGLAALAFLVGAGGLGAKIETDINFKSNIVVAGVLAVALAVALDALLLAVGRLLTPWRRATP
jgi:osmoprotectant transport system permease protein